MSSWLNPVTWPIGLQGLLMAIDEGYFHRKRGLPAWERWGHPIDTLSFLAPLGIASFEPHTSFWSRTFIALSAFSCVCITKDEWVHSEVSSPLESWIHALLFVLHPIVLGTVYLSWTGGVGDSGPEVLPLKFLFLGISVFLAYQVVYWNFMRAAEPKCPNTIP